DGGRPERQQPALPARLRALPALHAEPRLRAVLRLALRGLHHRERRGPQDAELLRRTAMRAWPLWIGLFAGSGVSVVAERAPPARTEALQTEVAALRRELSAQRSGEGARALERLITVTATAEAPAAPSAPPPPPAPAPAPGEATPATQEEHAAR